MPSPCERQSDIEITVPETNNFHLRLWFIVDIPDPNEHGFAL
jgi:hypothetical protein